MEVKVEWSELRLWNGGECPVGPDEMVWVLFEDMSHDRGVACRYRWSHQGWPGDIIAYRVEVKPAPLIERWVNVFTDSDGKDVVSGLLSPTKIAALEASHGPMAARQILLREVRE